MPSLHPSVALNRGQYRAKRSRLSSRKFSSKASLEAALKANRTLQRSFLSKFLNITESVYQNRAKVAFYTNLLLHKTSPQATSFVLSPTGSRNRRWTKRFFVDHNGSEPDINPDTSRRRRVEKETFFHHTQPPWSSKEISQLMDYVQTFVKTGATDKTHLLRRETIPMDHSDEHPVLEASRLERTASDVVDFGAISLSLTQVQQECGDSFGRIHLRTADECRIQYECMIKREIFKNIVGAQEKVRALSQIVASLLPDVISNKIDWDIVAEKATTVLHLQPDVYRLTGWDCLLVYFKKLKIPLLESQTTSIAWTVQDDELVLKYLAAAGPQIVVDSKNSLVQNTLLALLSRKSKKQLFTRVNQSLLNPNMTKNDWSDYEERRLSICMKIYHSLSQEECNQLYCASTHCYGRGSKSVVDKWNRSINPEYSTRPFSREEDEELLQVMRSSLSHDNKTNCGTAESHRHLGWKELSQKYFPNRHPQRLQNRWSELASDQDIINRERAKFMNGSSAKSAIIVDGHIRKKRRRCKTSDDYLEL